MPEIIIFGNYSTSNDMEAFPFFMVELPSDMKISKPKMDQKRLFKKNLFCAYDFQKKMIAPFRQVMPKILIFWKISVPLTVLGRLQILHMCPKLELRSLGILRRGIIL